MAATPRVTIRAPVAERSTPVIRSVWQDQDGAPVPLDDVVTLTLSVPDFATGTALPSRSNVDVKSGLHASTGVHLTTLLAADTAMQGSSTAVGGFERRLLTLKMACVDGRTWNQKIVLPIQNQLAVP